MVRKKDKQHPDKQKGKGGKEEASVHIEDNAVTLSQKYTDIPEVYLSTGTPLAGYTISSDEPYIFTTSGTASSTGAYFVSATTGGVSLSPSTVWSVSSRQDELEEEISTLRKENRRLARDISRVEEAKAKKTGYAKKLEKNVEKLEKAQRFKYLLDRVNTQARQKLMDSIDFRNRFEESDSCQTIIMSVDIRRSTELMLRATDPQLYADSIIGLCADLTNIILDNFGVFDKFTGDGILAFFPDFYSGSDAPYWAMKAATECHNLFASHYQTNRKCFKSVLMDVGLGIGIDYGIAHLVKIQDELTVIGEPVVYACRMSGCEAGKTLLNQPAYNVLSESFGAYIHTEEQLIEIKHQGPTLAYLAKLSKKVYKPHLPEWVEAEY
ncbi:adenylate/guanylate cyclase domain-containing protein [Chloroflexota bacterium]